MGSMLRPDGAIFWVPILICICIISLSAADTSDPLSGIKEFHANFITPGQQSEPSVGQLPLSDREPGLVLFPPELLPHSPPVKQHIVMDNAHPEQHVEDMYALNRNMQMAAEFLRFNEFIY